jgi:hypothetical protein
MRFQWSTFFKKRLPRLLLKAIRFQWSTERIPPISLCVFDQHYVALHRLYLFFSYFITLFLCTSLHTSLRTLNWNIKIQVWRGLGRPYHITISGRIDLIMRANAIKLNLGKSFACRSVQTTTRTGDGIHPCWKRGEAVRPGQRRYRAIDAALLDGLKARAVEG